MCTQASSLIPLLPRLLPRLDLSQKFSKIFRPSSVLDICEALSVACECFLPNSKDDYRIPYALYCIPINIPLPSALLLAH